MDLRFPLKDVSVKLVDSARKVELPLYADHFWQMNQTEFAMQVEGVGSFYARDGREVEYVPCPGVTRESLELYLNGSVYGAILHQRIILPLHGSSFIYNKQTVIICGESGAGKSSLTAAFCLNGAEFLTDDITSLTIVGGKPYIKAFSDRIKLWDHTLEQLGLSTEELNSIDGETNKFYYEMESGGRNIYPLNLVVNLEVVEDPEIKSQEVFGASKVTVLRNEVYRWEYLQGMPANEKKYFSDLVSAASSVRILKVFRPVEVPVQEVMAYIHDQIVRKNKTRKQRLPGTKGMHSVPGEDNR